MKTQIDLKSAGLGLLIGVVSTFAIGAGTDNNNGRYQVSCGAGFSVMVDTQTGQAWTYISPQVNRNDANFFNSK